MRKFPLIDLVYGKYISVFFDNKEDESTLPHRTTIRVKERNQMGKPNVITDIPAGSLRYIPPKHPTMPSEGVYVLMAGPGGICVVGDEIEIIRGDVFEKIAESKSQMEAALAAAEIANKFAAKSQQEHVEEAMKTTKNVQDATQKFFPFYDQGRRNDQLTDRR